MPGSFPQARALIALGLIAIVALGSVGERDIVVRTIPRTLALYRAIGLNVNVRGLEFVHVAAEYGSSGDVTIAGEIRNVAGRRVRVPRLAFEIRDRKGAAVMAWSETSPANTLPIGRTLAFSSAPHRSPPEGRTVVVRFDAGDALPISVASRAP